jgi:hypothetical protein
MGKSNLDAKYLRIVSLVIFRNGFVTPGSDLRAGRRQAGLKEENFSTTNDLTSAFRKQAFTKLAS